MRERVLVWNVSRVKIVMARKMRTCGDGIGVTGIRASSVAYVPSLALSFSLSLALSFSASSISITVRGWRGSIIKLRKTQKASSHH